MPELPEVETWRRLAERNIRGKVIADAYAAEDDIVLPGLSPRRWRRALAGRTVREIRRKGKHLWMDCGESEAEAHPTFHFGMTGSFHVYRGEDERPTYLKAELTMDDGVRLGYRCLRRIGRVRLFTDPEREEPIASLGFDPLLDLATPDEFAEALARRRGPIKSILLDQSFAAGVGNWIADEILFQARVHPRTRGCDLDRDQVKRLRARMKAIVDKAVAVDADASRFPKRWLFHHRWGKRADARTAAGDPVTFATIGGRTTAWVPAVQPSPE